MKDDADRITAEYLMRNVPDWQAHEDAADVAREYVSPTRFIAGWVVVLALVAILFWGF